MLTSKKRAFAESLLAGKTQKEAAISAGFSEKSAKQTGYKLARDKDVIEHIDRMTNIREQDKPEIEKKADQINKSKLKYLDPLDFLRDVMNNEVEDPKLRVDAAKAMMPYIHTKLGESGKKEAKQQKALNASASKYGVANAPRLQ